MLASPQFPSIQSFMSLPNLLATAYCKGYSKNQVCHSSKFELLILNDFENFEHWAYGKHLFCFLDLQKNKSWVLLCYGTQKCKGSKHWTVNLYSIAGVSQLPLFPLDLQDLANHRCVSYRFVRKITRLKIYVLCGIQWAKTAFQRFLELSLNGCFTIIVLDLACYMSFLNLSARRQR